uniref:Bm558 n=1 Tax=Brugia malayi TaxID=6279 RepID=A0A0H5S8C2_BRUMA|nr:Bm558 [Brugia malayi]
MDQTKLKSGKYLIKDMPPTIIARIMLFILFFQLMLCGATLITTLYGSLRFMEYHKILPNFMQRYGLFLGVFIISLYATLITIIASFQIHKFCFVEATRFSENLLDLKLLKFELLTSSIATIGCAFILFISSFSWQKPIRDNILYAVKNAINDNDYAQDINTIQQRFECCGISIQGVEAHLIWLYYLSPDSAFQHDLYNEKGSLPWSCCRSEYKSMHCEQFAYERFVVPFNETTFLQIPSYATRFKKSWKCTSLADCKQKREIALNSVYKRDCSQAFYQAFKIGFFYLNGTMLFILGLCMISGLAVTNHLQTILSKKNFKAITPLLL